MFIQHFTEKLERKCCRVHDEINMPALLDRDTNEITDEIFCPVTVPFSDQPLSTTLLPDLSSIGHTTVFSLPAEWINVWEVCQISFSKDFAVLQAIERSCTLIIKSACAEICLPVNNWIAKWCMQQCYICDDKTHT